ncbi:MAG: FemAB family PEP-CTERM system-associated protein [Acidobacteria bacterium]|nr:FemAB family PEP-CTERM system-associated protein [Acidobacteriota bacterium]MCI0721074.1 FemAB family PEP-CTERM system-associated protein [Acidobacteriota bacterium]
MEYNSTQRFSGFSSWSPTLPASEQSLEVVQVGSDPDQSRLWDRFVKSHPHGTPFHLSAWQRVVASTFGHQPCHVRAVSSATGEMLGILPLFLVRSLIFGRMLISTPQAAYGGILASSELAESALLQRAQQLAREENAQFLELRNFQNLIRLPELPTKDLYVTFRQELFDDPEKNMQAIPRKTRAEIREGIRNGLEFCVNAIGVDGFYDVYSRSVRELGTPVFSKRLFTSGLREFDVDCRIFSVHWKGRLVSAVWTLFYKDAVVPYYGGSIREYNHLAVNNFMYWMLIRYGCENGYRIFDFGRSKKGTGSFNFKKRWGMTISDLPYQYFLSDGASIPDTSPLNPKFAFGIRLWRHMPLWLTNTIGPAVSRHLI